MISEGTNNEYLTQTDSFCLFIGIGSWFRNHMQKINESKLINQHNDQNNI